MFIKRNILRARGWKKLLLVTSDYHVARAKRIFSFILGPAYGLEVVGAKTDAEGKQAAEEKSLKAFESSFAGVSPSSDDAAIWAKLAISHPYYNGDIYPQINID